MAHTLTLGDPPASSRSPLDTSCREFGGVLSSEPPTRRGGGRAPGIPALRPAPSTLPRRGRGARPLVATSGQGRVSPGISGRAPGWAPGRLSGSLTNASSARGRAGRRPFPLLASEGASHGGDACAEATRRVGADQVKKGEGRAHLRGEAALAAGTPPPGSSRRWWEIVELPGAPRPVWQERAECLGVWWPGWQVP